MEDDSDETDEARNNEPPRRRRRLSSIVPSRRHTIDANEDSTPQVAAQEVSNAPTGDNMLAEAIRSAAAATFNDRSIRRDRHALEHIVDYSVSLIQFASEFAAQRHTTRETGPSSGASNNAAQPATGSMIGENPDILFSVLEEVLADVELKSDGDSDDSDNEIYIDDSREDSTASADYTAGAADRRSVHSNVSSDGDRETLDLNGSSGGDGRTMDSDESSDTDSFTSEWEHKDLKEILDGPDFCAALTLFKKVLFTGPRRILRQCAWSLSHWILTEKIKYDELTDDMLLCLVRCLEYSDMVCYHHDDQQDALDNTIGVFNTVAYVVINGSDALVDRFIDRGILPAMIKCLREETNCIAEFCLVRVNEKYREFPQSAFARLWGRISWAYLPSISLSPVQIDFLEQHIAEHCRKPEQVFHVMRNLSSVGMRAIGFTLFPAHENQMLDAASLEEILERVVQIFGDGKRTDHGILASDAVRTPRRYNSGSRSGLSNAALASLAASASNFPYANDRRLDREDDRIARGALVRNWDKRIGDSRGVDRQSAFPPGELTPEQIRKISCLISNQVVAGNADIKELLDNFRRFGSAVVTGEADNIRPDERCFTEVRDLVTASMQENQVHRGPLNGLTQEQIRKRGLNDMRCMTLRMLKSWVRSLRYFDPTTEENAIFAYKMLFPMWPAYLDTLVDDTEEYRRFQEVTNFVLSPNLPDSSNLTLISGMHKSPGEIFSLKFLLERKGFLFVNLKQRYLQYMVSVESPDLSDEDMPEPLTLVVSRECPLMGLYEKLGVTGFSAEPISFLNRSIVVSFLGAGETEVAAIDEGGPLREAVPRILEELFRLECGFFALVEDCGTLALEPYWCAHHLDYSGCTAAFELLGMVIAMCLLLRTYSPMPFTRLFTKHLLGHERRAEDSEIIMERRKMLGNVANVEDLCVTFSVEDSFTSMVVDLIPNGRNIIVTNRNVTEYRRLFEEFHLEYRFSFCMKHVSTGRNKVIPWNAWKHFSSVTDAEEVSALLMGHELDVADWKEYTSYDGYTLDSPVVQWFWQLVESFSRNEREDLWTFISGSKGVPPGGFGHIVNHAGEATSFTIARTNTCVSHLPVAHTCGYQLDLPPYESKEQLQAKLRMAMSNRQGFGLL
eukprot:GEMP01009303.1.p1 GENE.GEMP01009303.1~~GEMP01009303.1.p1  ORF type:complete len:1143 (+),score=216.98 GEMP01009303.1:34-3429(+)